MTSRTSLVCASLLALVPVRAFASNGVVVGLELGGGPWSVNPTQIAAKAANQDTLTLADAQAFTNPMNGQWEPDLNLHAGWNIFGYVALEATFQASIWQYQGKAGGAGLAGARGTFYPLQIFWNPRLFDFGIEFGGGYTEAGGPTYGMNGSYFSFGLTAEYYATPAVSIELFYRLYVPYWNTFILNYDANETVPVPGFSASCNTIGIGVNFHAG